MLRKNGRGPALAAGSGGALNRSLLLYRGDFKACEEHWTRHEVPTLQFAGTGQRLRNYCIFIANAAKSTSIEFTNGGPAYAKPASPNRTDLEERALLACRLAISLPRWRR